MANINDYLSNLSMQSLMDLSKESYSSTIEENSIIRDLIRDYNLSNDSFFVGGIINLRDSILVEVTRRHFENLK